MQGSKIFWQWLEKINVRTESGNMFSGKTNPNTDFILGIQSILEAPNRH